MSHKGWHSRNYLPHFDSQDVIQFVTFRLADSLPAEALQRLKNADRPETLRHELLDRGWGACWLKSEPIARLVENAFIAFDGDRYRLHAWTIMPNHVHVPTPLSETPSDRGSDIPPDMPTGSSDERGLSGKPNTGTDSSGTRPISMPP